MLRALGRAGPRLPLAVRVQPARGRKSRHDPPAKSKAGRTATPPAVDPAELWVLSERYARYRQTVGALRREFAREVRERLLEARVGSQAARKAQQDAAEHRELLAWNQAENRRLHELRVARRLREAQDEERRRAELEARRAEEARAWARLKEEEVLRLQEEAKNFITFENLDAKVQEALDSPKSYNWAITREGQVVQPQHKGS
ncbi:28S ribosomal protein S26, mitochondrial [Suncus etruscus]|uniref:28S ribosomal protein S26, mitochondrial n=1 Tax=Suncus etruscus TaxID=109475 RepID=UPI0021105B8A|nr:28S ribosomal protein S26, mitochondrial [Suncus etruscus]